jgi:hypothetical protein
MENLTDDLYNKYQVTIHFKMDNDFMSFVPPHRIYINELIDKGVVEYYTVSMETQRCWMLINALSKNEVTNYLQKSPLRKYWTIETDELFVYDAQSYRLPALHLN